MILGNGRHRAGSAATLDDLFRRVGVRHHDAVAVVDPPNREDFTDGPQRTLSFAGADRAISALAARLRELGLQTDALVAMQLPNTVESLIALLGVLRAGMIAVPIPLLWRQQEMVAALGRVGAKAILTSARIGSVSHADIAMHAAVDLFSIRHVCAFGRDLPDGIVPLDDIFTANDSDATPAFPRLGDAAAHVAAVTFDLDAGGLVPIARSHTELVAGGLETFLETDAGPDIPILSTIPVGSFAGISLTALPWLLSGGALHLHHGFEPAAFGCQARAITDGLVVLPAPAIPAIADAALLHSAQTIIALWRAPERLAAAKAWQAPSALVDVASFGEIGLVAARRGMNALPVPIAHGVVDNLRRAPGAPTVIETTRTETGTLALRGRMVPAQAFPPGAERGHLPHLAPNRTGYVDTCFACRVDRDGQALTITAPPAGIISIGGYRIRQKEIDEMIAQIEPDATIVALPDADLGQRLAGTSAHRDALRTDLQARGTNPLIAGAFQPRGGAEAA
jgi:AMP-binding enzyme